MTRLPHVSVVIETITARYDAVTAGSLVADLRSTMRGLATQDYPHELVETLIVVDPAVATAVAEQVAQAYPSARLVSAATDNYYAAKNAGIAAARHDVVALVDSDCTPEQGWLSALVGGLEAGADVTAGRTRYADDLSRSWALSVPDFAHVIADDAGRARAFNINNMAFARHVLLAEPFDERLRRNGGCTLLFHRLVAAGVRVDYVPGARVRHGSGDISGLHFLRKHFSRGHDSVDVYRLDDALVLRGSRLVQRWGPPALIAITARRVGQDWGHLARHRTQVGVTRRQWPVVAAVGALLRLVELAGMLSNRRGSVARRAPA